MFGIKTRIIRAYRKRREMSLSAERQGVAPLPYTLWGLEVNGRGHLAVSGWDIAELAATYGTPLHIIHEEHLRSRCRDVLAVPEGSRVKHEVFFSYKTNPVPGMLAIAHEEGVGAEVISDYELWLAYRLAVPPDRIIYNGVAKTAWGIGMAVEKGVRTINIDSLNEIELIAAAAERQGRRVDVGIRILPGRGWAGQFGLSLDDGTAIEGIKRVVAMKDRLHVKGLHFHLGTLLKSTDPYLAVLPGVLAFAAEMKKRFAVELSYLDTGGGYAVPTVKALEGKERDLMYRYGAPPLPPENPAYPTPGDYIRAITGKVEELCNLHDLTYPTVILEPGRMLSSGSQFLVIQVRDIKAGTNGLKIAICDGGINIATPVLGEYREAFLVNRPVGDKRERCRLVGNTCSIGDVLYPAKFLPPLVQGDYIAIMDGGAYFVPNANNFSYPRPSIVIVSKDGHRVTRQRETFEFMADNDILGDKL